MDDLFKEEEAKEKLVVVNTILCDEEQTKTIHSYKTGASYDGEVDEGMRHGKGEMKWTNNVSYIGEWKGNYASGISRLNFSDGSFYEGDFMSNQMHGNGIQRWKDGMYYYGKW